MITQWQTYPIKIDGGLKTNISEIQHGLDFPGSATRLTNFEPSISGGIRRINGYTKWDDDVVPSVDSASLLLGVFFFDGAVVVAREGSVYTSSGSGWTSIQSGRTQTTKQRSHVINFDGTRKLVVTDGVNYPYTWDGTNFAELTGTTDVQAAAHVVDFKDHLFVSKGDLISFSAPFDETDFTAANGAGNFRVENDVTGMIVFRERLFIFTEDTISVLDGSSSADFSLTSVSRQVGCVREDTIQQVSGDVAFLSADGVRMLGATERIGDFSNLTASSSIQKDMIDFVSEYANFSSTVVRSKSQYRIMGTSADLPALNCGGFIGTQFEPQNTLSFQWAELTGLRVYAVDSKVYSGEEYIVFIDNEKEYVYRMEQGNDYDGTAITAAFWTPYFSVTDPLKRKTFYKGDFFIKAEGPVQGSVSLSLDQGRESRPQPAAIPIESDGTGAIWGEFEWDSEDWSEGSIETRIEKQLIGSGFTASLRFEFPQTNPPFIFGMILLEYTENDRI